MRTVREGRGGTKTFVQEFKFLRIYKITNSLLLTGNKNLQYYFMKVKVQTETWDAGRVLHMVHLDLYKNNHIFKTQQETLIQSKNCNIFSPTATYNI